jgi:RHS repeat-associated protein
VNFPAVKGVSPTVTYDANGNTLSDPSAKSYTWDFENRLTQVVNPGVGTTTFRYDPFGRRIQKSGPLGTTNYLYDGENDSVLQEVDSNGSVLARYTEGKGLDEPLAELRSGTASYYQQDALSSVTSLSNSAGALANTYTYDAFGKLTASTGTLTNPFKFTGREFDLETSIDYYRARYYDQNTGRFISEDPIRFKAGTNFYKYVGNSPTNWIDPFGLQECPKQDYCICFRLHAEPVGVCVYACRCESGGMPIIPFPWSRIKKTCGSSSICPHELLVTVAVEPNKAGFGQYVINACYQ